MRQVLVFASVGAICLAAACSPAPRSVSYFEAHRDEVVKVLSDCKAGTHRGAECTNAEAADAKQKSDSRMALYKSGFQ